MPLKRFYHRVKNRKYTISIKTGVSHTVNAGILVFWQIVTLLLSVSLRKEEKKLFNVYGSVT